MAARAKHMAANYKKYMEAQGDPQQLFKLDALRIPAAKVTSDLKELSSATFPCILKEKQSPSTVEALLSSPCGTALTRFAGKYKMQEDHKQTGRDHKFIAESLGREDVLKFLSNIEPPNNLDISKIQGGANFMAGNWFYGCSPALQDVSFSRFPQPSKSSLCTGKSESSCARWGAFSTPCIKMKTFLPLSTRSRIGLQVWAMMTC